MDAVNADVTRPQEISRQFGLNKNLTWKISKILSDDSPEAVVRHLPGRPGLAILMRTLEKAGAPASERVAFERAVDEYDAFIRDHAGDRDTLGVMVASFGGPQLQREEDSRRLSFQGNSATWGVQARLQLSVHLVLPSRQTGRMDIVVVSALVDFRRLRADVVWPIAVVRSASDSGSPLVAQAEPLDSSVVPGEAPLMHRFSSLPASMLRAAPGASGSRRYELRPGSVGRMSVVTCVVGRVNRGIVSPWKTETDEWGEHFVSLNTPAELLIHEIWMHRDLPLARPPASALPTAHVYGQLPGVPAYPSDARDQGLLPISATCQSVETLGADSLPEFPQYSELIEAACVAVGCHAGEFSGVRLRLPYPPMPALAVIRYPLADAPSPTANPSP